MERKKHKVTKENNKIIVSSSMAIPISEGEYTMEELIKEIEKQAKKMCEKAKVIMTKDGAIIIDLVGE